jgi:hypothetical protein
MRYPGLVVFSPQIACQESHLYQGYSVHEIVKQRVDPEYLEE